MIATVLFGIPKEIRPLCREAQKPFLVSLLLTVWGYHGDGTGKRSGKFGL